MTNRKARIETNIKELIRSKSNSRFCEILDILKMKGIQQKELAKSIGCTQELISRMKTNTAPVSEQTAELICKKYPELRISPAWLLGYDDFRNEDEKTLAELKGFAAEINEGATNKSIINAAVADMMRIYGLDWNGKLSKSIQYSGVDISSWELSIIADKIFDTLGNELAYLVRLKEMMRLDPQGGNHDN